jgi:benzoyl-CoA 2,3-epoxidase subunit B
LQKKANLHFSLTLDLFGNEISTNAANAFNAGIKGRYREDKLEDDHLLTSSVYPVLRQRDGAIIKEDVPALSALNMRLRDDFVDDAAAGVARWNRVLERTSTEFRMTLPHVAFNRRIGEFSTIHTDTNGNIIGSEAWHSSRESMLPSNDDNVFITSLMHPSLQPGSYAGWIAPPRQGIDNMPGDFEYVRLVG